MKYLFAKKMAALGFKPLRPDMGPMLDVDIKDLETKLGSPLPSDYRAYLSAVGGVCGGALIARSENHHEHEVLEELYGGINDESQLWSVYQIFSSVLPPSMVPIGSDGFSNQFCIATSGPDRGKVFFWNRDIGKAEFVACSFDDFVHRLEEWKRPF